MCNRIKSIGVLMVAAGLAVAARGADAKPSGIRGAWCVPLAPGVPSITVTRVNETGQGIYDFTIWIVGNSGARIEKVEVSSSQNGGCDDWDVDDDGDGASQEPGEKDDIDSSPGTSTRVDSRGNGKNNDNNNEDPPQNRAGKPIQKDKTFTIKVTFNPRPTAGAEICFAPTDNDAGQIDSGTTVAYGLYNGLNTYAYDSGHPFPSVTSSQINHTGGVVTGLAFHATSDYSLLWLEQLDSLGETLVEASCDGTPACTLLLAQPVMPGGDVSFSAHFDHYAPDGATALTVMPLVEPGPPTGACCLPDGSCLEAVFVQECFARGGVYLGDGTICDPAGCQPMPTGACFFEQDQSCYEGYNAWDCAAGDGIYLGDGSRCETMPGDVDGDGDVDLSDLATLLGAYGRCAGDPLYNPAADFDGDGCITLNDLAELLGNYGRP